MVTYDFDITPIDTATGGILTTDEITLIEAKNDHEEVLSIAAAIRIAIEPDKDKRDPNIALVTPDRNLARRVSIALKQYGLDANDSGGQSLDQTPIGSLITLTLLLLLCHYFTQLNLALHSLTFI